MSDNKITIEYNKEENSIVFTESRDSLSGILLTKVNLQDLLSEGIDEGCRLLGENVLLFLDSTRDLIG